MDFMGCFIRNPLKLLSHHIFVLWEEKHHPPLGADGKKENIENSHFVKFCLFCFIYLRVHRGDIFQEMVDN